MNKFLISFDCKGELYKVMRIKAALIVDGHYFIKNNKKIKNKWNVVKMLKELEQKWNLCIEKRYWYTNVLDEEKHRKLKDLKRFLMEHDKGALRCEGIPNQKEEVCHVSQDAKRTVGRRCWNCVTMDEVVGTGIRPHFATRGGWVFYGGFGGMEGSKEQNHLSHWI